MINRGLLAGLHVLDLSGPFGAYGTRLLADLGAEVVRLQTGDQDSCAEVGPFDNNGHSYFAEFVNANKRSVCLNTSRFHDQDVANRAAEWADIIVTDETGCGPAFPADSALRSIGSRDGAITVQIQAFDQTSGSAQYLLDDLSAQAVGGMMSLTGEPSREPLALYGGQSYFIVGVHVASAALIGLSASDGGHYVVTIHEAIVHTLETAIQYYTTEGVVRSRKGTAQQAGDGSYRSADGRIVLGAMTDLEWGRLIAWLMKRGVDGAANCADWTLEERRDPENVATFATLLEGFTTKHPRTWLTRDGQANRVLISPSYSLTDLVDDEQLAFDGYFQYVRSSDGASLLFPGAPYRVSGGAPSIREGAHRFGEDTDWFLADRLCLEDAVR